ncbi:MAG: carboxylating nicotinate-nucleotide diphosphorylase [Steroidobacteraceae bacterium]
MPTLPPNIAEQVASALREDIGTGDVTAQLVPATATAEAIIVSREAATLCGTAWVEETFLQLDPTVRVSWSRHDGDRLSEDQTICSITGPARPILTGERTVLNFLQLLSGTATTTKRYVDAIAGTGCTALDTRKTVPGLRLAQKYAVQCGGGSNHRLGLYDLVLIKENHIVAAGSIGAAVSAARRMAHGLKVEVEVENLAEFAAALSAEPDIIMLDDMSLDDLRKAVTMNFDAGRSVRLEASGSITLENVRAIAETGVDYVSIGRMTKNVRAVDLSMRFNVADS